jgi:hypothetical protein
MKIRFSKWLYPLLSPREIMSKTTRVAKRNGTSGVRLDGTLFCVQLRNYVLMSLVSCLDVHTFTVDMAIDLECPLDQLEKIAYLAGRGLPDRQNA